MAPTPLRAIRVNDKLWNAAKKKAAKEGTTVSKIIIEALQTFMLTK
jgi:predicted DNA binding CopG/RHH family protein